MDPDCVRFLFIVNLLFLLFKFKFVGINYIYSKGESTVLKGHTGAVRSVNFSADSRNLITASDDKLIKVCLCFHAKLLYPTNSLF